MNSVTSADNFYWISLYPGSRHFAFFEQNDDTGHQSLLAECILPEDMNVLYSEYFPYVDNIMGDIVLSNS